MDDIIRIKTPKDLDSINEAEVFKKYTRNRSAITQYVRAISEPVYLHWEKSRFKPHPKGFSGTEAWFLAREVRKLSSRETAIRTESGQPFTWLRLTSTDKFLRYIDMYAGGHFLLDHSSESERMERNKYLSRGIIEEAIASSQLEGASTTRQYAKKMIAENRKPRDTSDWMILNNYRTLQTIEEEFKHRDLSLELLFELHALLTKNTLEDEGIGRLRTDKDNIVVTFENKIAHIPPKAAVLKKEIKRLIDYVNDDETFVHPVIKAIFLHFWIGYLHPFIDGNGRLARSLFYWYLLKNDYWAMAYLPISLVIKRAPHDYAYAYLYSEQDNADLTYFYDYNIRKIVQAIDEFKEYVDTLKSENQAVDRKLQVVILANERQKQIVHYLVADSTHYVTITSQQNLENVARATARKDILTLHEKGLLVARRAGNSIRYYASEKLLELLQLT